MQQKYQQIFKNVVHDEFLIWGTFPKDISL